MCGKLRRVFLQDELSAHHLRTSENTEQGNHEQDHKKNPQKTTTLLIVCVAVLHRRCPSKSKLSLFILSSLPAFQRDHSHFWRVRFLKCQCEKKTKKNNRDKQDFTGGPHHHHLHLPLRLSCPGKIWDDLIIWSYWRHMNVLGVRMFAI